MQKGSSLPTQYPDPAGEVPRAGAGGMDRRRYVIESDEQAEARDGLRSMVERLRQAAAADPFDLSEIERLADTR